MKKHRLVMVFLLILTLCLIGAVSANDNVSLGDSQEVLVSCESGGMDLTADNGMSYENLANSYGTCEVSSCGEEIQSRPSDANYELGYEIGKDFIDSADIVDSDDVLVITNAGFLEIDSQTTENVLNGIVDASKGYITYENGNLMTISSNVDSVYVAFFIKNGESLPIVFYKDTITPLYYGNAGSKVSASLLEELMIDDVGNILSVIDSWANGSLDDLNPLTCQRHVLFGLLGVTNKLQTAKKYPHE